MSLASFTLARPHHLARPRSCLHHAAPFSRPMGPYRARLAVCPPRSAIYALHRCRVPPLRRCHPPWATLTTPLQRHHALSRHRTPLAAVIRLRVALATTPHVLVPPPAALVQAPAVFAPAALSAPYYAFFGPHGAVSCSPPPSALPLPPSALPLPLSPLPLLPPRTVDALSSASAAPMRR
ncbi:hypothetical protein DENSPDRAFT_883579 [Dentipellis sp. KUC8613]|nr:hypothetical protein DENSPDRAFT_883579 [Dentipellis sp. KUC8613]